jgi:5-methylcytosine-specific restriction enzyme subunit McrC
MTSTIPIQNIYYLLCYAWNKLDEGETVDIASLESTELADLFTRVLSNGVHHLIRRGFDRDYLAFTEETPRIRGRINFSASLKRNLLKFGRPLCEFDELSYNVLHNQILKTTIHNLINTRNLHSDLKDELWEVSRWLRDVDQIRLTAQIFRRVRLHRNNNFYRFLLNICELVFENLLIDEKSGNNRFRDFTRDEGKMRALFEEFVRRFYKLHQTRFDVNSYKLSWNAESDEPNALQFIPEMRTDICLVSPLRQIIIDCKFSKNIFKTYRGKESVSPAHLYQIYTYLRHAEQQKGWKNLEGILLYPVVNQDVNLSLNLDGYPFQIRTIDLNQHWQNIEFDLLKIIN